MIEVNVDMQTVARHLRDNPDDMLEMLASLAASFDDLQGQDSFALDQYSGMVAENHSGSVADQMVAPFLTGLAAKLQHVEAMMP